MAVIHKGDNELKGRAQKNLLLSIVFTIPTLLYMFLFFTQSFHFPGFFHLLAIVPAAIGSYFWRQYDKLRSGIKGEERTTKALANLPDGYEVFTSVKIATGEGRTELDQLIVGEKGIFIVEVKNHNGKIVGHEEDHSWVQHKVGQKGGRYTSNMKNPVKQVRRQVYLLSQYLKENKSQVWIEGVVLFSNRRATVNVRTERTPVFSDPDQLSYYLSSYQPKRKPSTEQLNKVKNLLKR
ncbi:nuclease-related domain-containing protein [Evansella cellulosilytica]|uniref:NERD domain protein n=1 Tax=Evansella cellulosilytica (strain ATCC 21833 / DSM 2522 / FERM P-1141 / JCM 9156 / N-4) TaxID=649639 RepID=E6TTW2_EVAC2|nr:nuclease-related domain-containing protein [Evansella cellulosilytica]ADU31993.1 NERD domain protein [Evansella cellulosilytica DSM 2522]